MSKDRTEKDFKSRLAFAKEEFKRIAKDWELYQKDKPKVDIKKLRYALRRKLTLSGVGIPDDWRVEVHFQVGIFPPYEDIIVFDVHGWGMRSDVFLNGEQETDNIADKILLRHMDHLRKNRDSLLENNELLTEKEELCGS